MQHLIDISIASIAWVVAIAKLRPAWHGRRDRVVLSSWLFVFLFALCMTFQVDPIYIAFDTAVHIPNLAWLIAYYLLMSAIYSAAVGCLLASKAPRSRWLFPLTITVAIILLVVFIIGIAVRPDRPDHAIPQTFLELVFIDTLYLYAVMAGSVSLRTFYRFYRRENNITTRLRTGAILLGAAMAIAFFAVGLLTSMLHYWLPTLPFLDFAALLVRILMGGAGILWAIGFLPHKTFLFLSRPIEFVQKANQLRDLYRVQRELRQFCPSVVNDSLRYWRFWANLDFHLYRTMIGILDSKRMLAAFLSRLAAGETELHPLHPDIAYRFEHMDVYTWDEDMLIKAKTMHQLMARVDDTQPYPQLLTAYQRMGNQ